MAYGLDLLLKSVVLTLAKYKAVEFSEGLDNLLYLIFCLWDFVSLQIHATHDT